MPRPRKWEKLFSRFESNGFLYCIDLIYEIFFRNYVSTIIVFCDIIYLLKNVAEVYYDKNPINQR